VVFQYAEHSAGESVRELFEDDCLRLPNPELRFHGPGSKRTYGWQAMNREDASHASALEKLRRVLECQATVASPVLMTALVSLSEIAEKQGSRRKDLRTERGAISEASFDDDSD
jgi:hypothetical protein